MASFLYTATESQQVVWRRERDRQAILPCEGSNLVKDIVKRKVSNRSVVGWSCEWPQTAARENVLVIQLVA